MYGMYNVHIFKGNGLRIKFKNTLEASSISSKLLHLYRLLSIESSER